MDSSLWSHLFSSTDGPTVHSSLALEDRSTASAALLPPPGFDSQDAVGQGANRLCYSQNSAGLTTARGLSTMGSHSQVSSTATAVVPSEATQGEASSALEPSIPRRNLTEAFEELYVEIPEEVDAAAPAAMHDTESSNASKTSIVSPTGVAEFQGTRTLAKASSPNAGESSSENAQAILVPRFTLHPLLQRDMSQQLVDRVSLHSVIHDINKEGASMAANDDSSFCQSGSAGDETAVSSALIDEEKWLLSVIDSCNRDEVKPVAACPPTFLQAMGEKEYDSSLLPPSRDNTNRTTLWKPSRSWWEAKSGKNPWIEPDSHNKRWRYLWPLIYYHKLLTKCIKKLKRNGLDVKTSVSPVAAFLRDDVCAVSDHLAAVSVFDSDEWMECLAFYQGWTSTSAKAEARLQSIVANLELRSLAEPQDVDSALLRTQIDQKLLRAMAAARDQISKHHNHGTKTDGRPPRHTEKWSRRKSAGRGGHNETSQSTTKSGPQHSSVNSSMQQISADSSNQRWGYPQHGQWWGPGWPQYACCDESSVQSALTYDSHPKQHHHKAGAHHSVYPGYGPHPYPPPMTQEQYQYYYAAAGPMPHFPYQYHVDPGFVESGWVGYPHMDPGLVYGPPQQPADASGYSPQPCTPGTPSSPYQMAPPYAQSPAHGGVGSGSEGDQTPYGYDPNGPVSPFWGHIDAAIMQGLMTPGKASPQTPPRLPSGDDEGKDGADDFAKNAKPLLFSGSHYYFGYGAREGYAPPSPATQFMMSPSNPGSASFYAQSQGYGGYGFSPARPGSNVKSQSLSDPLEGPDEDVSTAQTTDTECEGVVTPPPAVRKVTTDESTEATAV